MFIEDYENLMALSKPELILIIEEYWNTLRKTGEVTLQVSKCHTEPEDGINEIRDSLQRHNFQNFHADELAFLTNKCLKENIVKYFNMEGGEDEFNFYFKNFLEEKGFVRAYDQWTIVVGNDWGWYVESSRKFFISPKFKTKECNIEEFLDWISFITE